MGNLYNPDVHYIFNIPIEERSNLFSWDPYGPWQDCTKMCQGTLALNKSPKLMHAGIIWISLKSGWLMRHMEHTGMQSALSVPLLLGLSLSCG